MDGLMTVPQSLVGAGEEVLHMLLWSSPLLLHAIDGFRGRVVCSDDFAAAGFLFFLWSSLKSVASDCFNCSSRSFFTFSF